MAPILILYEPTSSLDVTTGLSYGWTMRLMALRTTFIIAHRLSTVSRFATASSYGATVRLPSGNPFSNASTRWSSSRIYRHAIPPEEVFATTPGSGYREWYIANPYISGANGDTRRT